MACPTGIVAAPVVEAMALYKEKAGLPGEVVELRQENEALRRERGSRHEGLTKIDSD